MSNTVITDERGGLVVGCVIVYCRLPRIRLVWRGWGAFVYTAVTGVTCVARATVLCGYYKGWTLLD